MRDVAFLRSSDRSDFEKIEFFQGSMVHCFQNWSRLKDTDEWNTLQHLKPQDNFVSLSSSSRPGWYITQKLVNYFDLTLANKYGPTKQKTHCEKRWAYTHTSNTSYVRENLRKYMKYYLVHIVLLLDAGNVYFQKYGLNLYMNFLPFFMHLLFST